MAEPLYPLLGLSRLRMGTDGTGVTTLIAGAGCPLRCRWCINEKLLREAPAENVTAAELLGSVKIDDLYFRATGGGVCFGGGESLLHAVFIRRFRELCPDEWAISAETSLAVPRETWKRPWAQSISSSWTARTWTRRSTGATPARTGRG